MSSSQNELFLDYKAQHELQFKLAREPYAVRLRLKSIYSCKRSVIPSQGHVNVIVSRRGNLLKSGFANLYNCKSTWACPTCAGYALAQHRDKITALINYYAARKIWACMITFTVPHQRFESLSTVMQRLKTCMEYTSLSVYLSGSIGSIKSTEVTYNDNTGWHPHYHILCFIKATHWHKLTDDVAHIRRRWMSKLEELGYFDTESRHPNVYISLNRRGHPRKITNGDYIAKEMAKLKRGARPLKSRTPWDLITAPEPWYFDKFIEYATVTQGLHRVHYARSLHCQKVLAEYKLERPLEHFFERVCETEVLCSFTKADWYEIISDELATHRRHRRRILMCACIGYWRVVQYCLDNELPTPIPPINQVVNAVAIVD